MGVKTYNPVKDIHGYTIVETLVASAILLGVLIPAAFILGKLTIGSYSRQVLVATQLAREVMEKTLASEEYHYREMDFQRDNKHWKVIREVNYTDGVVDIRVKVYRSKKHKPLVELMTLRIVP